MDTRGQYFSPELMGNYGGNVTGSSYLAVENIFSTPSPTIKCNIKQPFSVSNVNSSLFFDLKQGEGITFACNVDKADFPTGQSGTFKRKPCSPCGQTCTLEKVRKLGPRRRR